MSALDIVIAFGGLAVFALGVAIGWVARGIERTVEGIWK